MRRWGPLRLYHWSCAVPSSKSSPHNPVQGVCLSLHGASHSFLSFPPRCFCATVVEYSTELHKIFAVSYCSFLWHSTSVSRLIAPLTAGRPPRSSQYRNPFFEPPSRYIPTTTYRSCNRLLLPRFMGEQTTPQFLYSDSHWAATPPTLISGMILIVHLQPTTLAHYRFFIVVSYPHLIDLLNQTCIRTCNILPRARISPSLFITYLNHIFPHIHASSESLINYCTSSLQTLQPSRYPTYREFLIGLQRAKTNKYSNHFLVFSRSFFTPLTCNFLSALQIYRQPCSLNNHLRVLAKSWFLSHICQLWSLT